MATKEEYINAVGMAADLIRELVEAPESIDVPIEGISLRDRVNCWFTEPAVVAETDKEVHKKITNFPR